MDNNLMKHVETFTRVITYIYHAMRSKIPEMKRKLCQRNFRRMKNKLAKFPALLLLQKEARAKIISFMLKIFSRLLLMSEVLIGKIAKISLIRRCLVLTEITPNERNGPIYRRNHLEYYGLLLIFFRIHYAKLQSSHILPEN